MHPLHIFIKKEKRKSSNRTNTKYKTHITSNYMEANL